MRVGAAILWAAVGLSLMPANVSAQSQWQPVEQIQTYPVTGDSGVDLYASIGERGPKIGREVRAIAHTNFKLTWTRDYRPQPDGACTLVSARPKLIITYTLPKPAGKLPPALQARWDTFAAGLIAHEKVHGAGIVDMVDKIVAFSTGLTAENDPGCKKVRAELTTYLDQLSKAQRQGSRDFDTKEFGQDGNMLKLIVAFLGGVPKN